MDPTEIIAKDKTVLRKSSRKSGGDADRTKNIQTWELIILAHLSFGNSDVRPTEWSLSLRAGPNSDVSYPHFVEQRVAEGVCMGERKNSEPGLDGTLEPADVTRGIEAVTWKGDGLIIIRQEETTGEFAVRSSEIVNIG